jgi:hypothetical protein
MANENEDHRLDCDAGAEDHRVTIRIDFVLDVDEDGDATPRAAAINTHIHGVPPMLAAQTLMLIAQRTVVQYLAHEVFEGCGDEEIQHAMAEASAPVYMKKLIDRMPDVAEEYTVQVPDDLSELLGDE